MDFMEEATARAMIAAQKDTIATQAAQIEVLTKALKMVRHGRHYGAMNATEQAYIDVALSNTWKK